ncbi:hypothetical protein APD05_07645 [Acinetobacter nosocomialis]|uniref:hypothetical protein n=1 Tax=Acinetobacter calcoaceticus/baumannii complex TaxID=909768 RepID=UPI00044BF7D5|nr:MULTISPECIES: hypothetical protein [Acinetobacter calcoaceticus/baumannii complex]EXS46443.1 hypothetical protein J660_1693 [Acinetobacter sp. 88816]KQD11416.1 hypothetical protein APD05_07645 [Acinetobacter nosocomialis]MCE5998356.1 hypothetical protein [Acinetobacter nosocomialis]HCU38798.1 hypothetical protein [Acinetobacter nosocomialis]
MKATKLIRDKGLQYAKEIVDSAPSNATEWNEGFEFQCGKSVEISKADREKYFVDLSELKRLVKSVEIINQAGGYKVVKTAISNYRASGDMVTFSSLEKRLKDYESIYGDSENA